jgi:hypothetical protein
MSSDETYDPIETPVRPPQPAGILPRDLERRLILASQLPVMRDRLRAIDNAVTLGRLHYPHLWRREARTPWL